MTWTLLSFYIPCLRAHLLPPAVPMHWGSLEAVGHPNKLHRAYTGALLATTVKVYERALNAVRIGDILSHSSLSKWKEQQL